MSRFIILAPGAVVESAGVRYVISHILSLESILAKDEATGKIAELKTSDEQLVSDAEDRGVGAYSKCQGDGGDQRKSRPSEEHPYTGLKVLY
jgi:hypothetical protein